MVWFYEVYLNSKTIAYKELTQHHYNILYSAGAELWYGCDDVNSILLF